MGSSGAGEKEATLPEHSKRLNLAIVCTVFLSKAMNGLGMLATIWATVVLLGGFSVLIKQQDFWYVTIVAFVESIGILGGYDDPTQQLLLRTPEVLINTKDAMELERRISWWRRRRINPEQHQSGSERRARLQVRKKDDEQRKWFDCETVLGTAIYIAVRLAQIAAVATCIVLSFNRLKKQDYVDPQHKGAEDHRNIRWSLNVFYGLVFTQGIIFSVLRNPVIYSLKVMIKFSYKLYGPSGRRVVERYWSDNYLEFITGNWRATLNMNLITFAKKLAVSDISVDDQLVGIRAMDRILRSVYSSVARARLRASLDADTLGKLINMLGFVGTPDEEGMRGHASRVLLKLSPDILLHTYPQIMDLISSSLLKSTAGNMDMDFVWFGLRILVELTNIQQNCQQAENFIHLLPKIIELTNLNIRCCHGQGNGSRRISDSWIEQEIIPLLEREEDFPPAFRRRIDQEIIVGMSLKILSNLVATPGDAGKSLRKETSANIHFLSDTGIILDHVGAARVIACIALDQQQKKKIGRSPEIIKKLIECLVKAAHVDITKVAANLLLLEYTNSEQLSQIKSSIQEKNIVLREDGSFSVPTTALIEALDLDQLLPPRMQHTAVQNLDLEDVLSAERVNHCEAAAKALAVLTSGCEENAAAVLQEITPKVMEMIVEMLFLPQDLEERRRRMSTRFQPETFRLVKKITCAAEEDRVSTSVNAKLLQNLRAHGGTEKFPHHMRIIDQALPQVLKGVVDQVAKLEQPGYTNENLANDNVLWVEAGKVFEGFIGLTLQICYCLDASGFANALLVADLTVVMFVLNLKKILELYKYPTTDFPSIRRATLQLMTWMVGNSSKYGETILHCGVYEQLKEVGKTGAELESFELFHCDVGIGNDQTSSISFLVSKLRAQLELCPNFHERSHYYGADERTITVLLA